MSLCCSNMLMLGNMAIAKMLVLLLSATLENHVQTRVENQTKVRGMHQNEAERQDGNCFLMLQPVPGRLFLGGLLGHRTNQKAL